MGEFIPRAEPQRFAGVGQGLFRLSRGLISQRQVVPRHRIAGIGLLPLLINREGFIEFSGDLAVVVTRDIKFFAFARPVLQFECLAEVLQLRFGLGPPVSDAPPALK